MNAFAETSWSAALSNGPQHFSFFLPARVCSISLALVNLTYFWIWKCVFFLTLLNIWFVAFKNSFFFFFFFSIQILEQVALKLYFDFLKVILTFFLEKYILKFFQSNLFSILGFCLGEHKVTDFGQWFICAYSFYNL